MKIALLCHGFSPAVGGIETVSSLVALSWKTRGEVVRVITRTPGGGDDDLGLTVIRNPGKAELAQHIAWADAVLMNNMSLPWVWPIVRSGKPWVCANHTWPRDDRDRMAWKNRLKRRAALLSGEQLGVSQVQARQFLGKPTIVGNPYNDAFFKPASGIERVEDLVFFGRLTSDKGVDVLLRAMVLVKNSNPGVRLTIVGDGQERSELEKLAGELELNHEVAFVGKLVGEALTKELSRHEIAVVPSTAAESFGIVALELAACGCVIIASDNGGLPEAVGPMGAIFRNGDSAQLAELALELLGSRESRARYRTAAPDHLRKFTAEAVAGRYLEALQRVVKRGGRR